MTAATQQQYSTLRATIAESQTWGAATEVCPFCGAVDSIPGQICPSCLLEDTPATRQATKQRVGPWYVLQKRNPAAPGMRFATLQSLVKKGLVTPRSVVRGPTTHQLWKLGSKVKGLSREFEICFACGHSIEATAALCPHCNRSQTVLGDVDALLETSGAPAAKPEMAPANAPVVEEAQSVAEPEPTVGLAVAERSSEQPPAPDVLSPRDLAKAFSLGYEPPSEPIVEVKSKGHGRKIAAVMLLVGIGGAAAVYFGNSFGHVKESSVHPATPPSAAPVEIKFLASADPAAYREAANEKPPAEKEKPVTDLNGENTEALWAAALEAESKRDFKQAVKLYERIQSLPSDAWPKGLVTRLGLAREEMRAGTR